MPDAGGGAPLPPDCWRQIFGNDRPVALEIGPGRGEFLVAAACANPDRNFFAIEHSYGRTREILARLAKHGVENVRVIAGDATCLIELLPEASVAAFYVLFPDPWWKRRHKKRLLVTPRFTVGLQRALAPGGTVELITDVPEYFSWAQSCLNDAGLEGVSVGVTTEIETSFARKARAAGVTLQRSVHRRPR